MFSAKPVFMPDNEGANKSVVHGAFGGMVEIPVKVFSIPKYGSVNWYRGINRDFRIIPSAKYSLSESSGIVEGEFHNTAVDLDGYILTLQINNLTIDDFNTYTIQIDNSFGSPAEYTINLELSGKFKNVYVSCLDVFLIVNKQSVYQRCIYKCFISVPFFSKNKIYDCES